MVGLSEAHREAATVCTHISLVVKPPGAAGFADYLLNFAADFPVNSKVRKYPTLMVVFLYEG